MAAHRLRELLRVEPGSKVRLAGIDPSDTHGHNKSDADKELADGLVRLAGLQDRLWAEAKHPVLVVLQGIDAAGKDGTVHHVMSAFSPQGCPVTDFKVPSALEMSHDYLWRVHQHTPGKGEIAIFNRSHYEDVLVVRVHDLVPKMIWKQRYDQINDWERMLVEEGTTIVKFFLLIDRDEQRKRFQERYDDPTKRWKFKMGDLAERALWDNYVGGLRGGPQPLLDGRGAVVRHPCQPELVPEPGGGRDPRRRPRGPEAGLPGHRPDGACRSRHRIARAPSGGRAPAGRRPGPGPSSSAAGSRRAPRPPGSRPGRRRCRPRRCTPRRPAGWAVTRACSG